MSKEEQLSECWRDLPPDAQEQVLKLAQSLKPQPEFTPQAPLAQKSWNTRQRAIAKGMTRLTESELEQELLDQPGRHREPSNSDFRNLSG